ncbi:MAG: excinuclease ABC subunit UvrC [Epsilonproteobacteria bacterium]|nr:excinuclease ABC subunit UvrC [Campylobacterota bacterium]
MKLAENLKKIPQSSGVYQYFDEFGKLLYIGKAKNLKNRVKSYFKFTPFLQPSPTLNLRIFKMISEAKEIKYLLVQNEQDALILENSLIKQLKPKYNILLRDDKTYPYITINLKDEFPRFEITRKITKEKGVKYFGPFTTSSREILNSLYLLFNLVQKKNCLKSKAACLFHQIQRCEAPCVGKIDKKEYAKIVNDALNALKNRTILTQLLEQKMLEASQLENFEEAMVLRDNIRAIKNSFHVSDIDLAKLKNIDIFFVHIKQKIAVILKMFMRNGKIISADNTILRNSQGFEKDELYKRVILQFYSNNSPLLCEQILVGDDFADSAQVQSYLRNTFKKSIKIHHPKIGDKAKLIKLAKQNTSYILQDVQNRGDIEAKIQNLFDLNETPYRIEVFDNSHLGGKATVGGMVVWEQKWQKDSYRKYTLHAKDEYSQMKELLTRRIEKFKENPPPNLWLLDGGATLLELAKKLLKEHDIKLDVLAISKEKLDSKSIRAKGRAKDILHSSTGHINLATSDIRLQFLQKLRDEAHRFAISFHQKKKRKEDLANFLTSIKGIGMATQKRLLSYFGTYDAIYNANIEELKIILSDKQVKTMISGLKLYTFK